MSDDTFEYAPKSEVHERIAVDLHAITLAVEEWEGIDSFGMLMFCLLGYVQTDLGIQIGDGDCAHWRHTATKAGLDLSDVRGLTYAERQYAAGQRVLYAELIVKEALAKASKPVQRKPRPM